MIESDGGRDKAQVPGSFAVHKVEATRRTAKGEI